jgi:hypothetical protein
MRSGSRSRVVRMKQEQAQAFGVSMKMGGACNGEQENSSGEEEEEGRRRRMRLACRGCHLALNA